MLVDRKQVLKEIFDNIIWECYAPDGETIKRTIIDKSISFYRYNIFN